jgi:hypothetical protein
MVSGKQGTGSGDRFQESARSVTGAARLDVGQAADNSRFQREIKRTRNPPAAEQAAGNGAADSRAGLGALPGADGTAPYCFRGSRCQSESGLAEVFYCLTASLPGACRDRVRSDPSGARLVVHVPAAMTPSEMEYSSGLFNPDTLGLAVRAERREDRLPAMGAMEFFHASSL